MPRTTHDQTRSVAVHALLFDAQREVACQEGPLLVVTQADVESAGWEEGDSRADWMSQGAHIQRLAQARRGCVSDDDKVDAVLLQEIAQP